MLLSQSTSSGLIVPEGGVAIFTDLASATPFAYPWSYNDVVLVLLLLLLLAAGVFVVVFVGVGGIPHISDSVELTKLSFGLLGLHIAAFCCAVNDDEMLLPGPEQYQYQNLQIRLMVLKLQQRS
jgi:hypothetical protein